MAKYDIETQRVTGEIRTKYNVDGTPILFGDINIRQVMACNDIANAHLHVLNLPQERNLEKITTTFEVNE